MDKLPHLPVYVKVIIADFLLRSGVHASPHLSTRQYARIVDSWVKEIGLDPVAYGTHSIRRTKPSLIYRRTKNLRAVQLLVGPHEAREHGSLPWHRGRGRLGVGRANRGVTLPRPSRIDRKLQSTIRLTSALGGSSALKSGHCRTARRAGQIERNARRRRRRLDQGDRVD